MVGKTNPISSASAIDFSNAFLPFLPATVALPTLPSTFLTVFKYHPNCLDTLISYAVASANSNKIEDFKRLIAVIGKIDRSNKEGLKELT